MGSLITMLTANPEMLHIIFAAAGTLLGYYLKRHPLDGAPDVSNALKAMLDAQALKEAQDKLLKAVMSSPQGK